jgi:predicted O-methyltransferase YrrM
MFFKITSYLKFIIRSSNKHGVHSPFIYNLITEGLKNNNSKHLYNKHLEYRQKLLKNNNTIEVTDFGAGSKVFKDNFRRINRISKNAGINKKRAHLLINIVKYLKSKTILEIGTSVGLGTAALHFGNPKANIITLEGCPNTMNVAKEQFNHFNFKNIKTITGEFDTSLENLSLKTTLDLVYFDGNHQKEATLKYFEFCLQHINNDSVFIFDDIHWSKSMEEAWKKIKVHSKVKVTIDTFQWGIVFFREEQQKEHFIIRV